MSGYTLRPGVSQYRILYETRYQEAINHIAQLDELAISLGDEQLAQLAQNLQAEAVRLNGAAGQMIRQVEADNAAGAAALVANLEAVAINERREEIRAYFEAENVSSTAEFEAAQSLLFKVLLLGTVFAVLVTVGLGLLIVRQLRSQMRRVVGVVEQSGMQVTTSSTQIAAVSRQLEANVTEQAASTTEISATAAEIAATAEKLSQTMSKVMGLSESAVTTASDGKQGLFQMEETIAQLTASTATISSKLGMIDDKANNISNVVTAITKVADQTNLLSLNAAIEAEKAGEYGAGFSVVAREIRRLADQTAIATLEIEKMVQEMLSSVSTGVMEMDRFTQDVSNNAANIHQISEQISQIIAQVQSLAPQFETVTTGMAAQAESAQQICLAMAQLNDSSQQTTESVKDANQAISLLGTVAQELQSEVSNFRLAV
ncbi:MAG: methyl-accepting chemotaxis protein [Cyanobacteria bacterium J06632_3]